MSKVVLIKYEHACLILERGGEKLVIDPGCFTQLPKDMSDVLCLIITEEHVDHFDIENVKAILSQNAKVSIFTTKAVHDKLVENGIDSTAIEGEQSIECAGYNLTFYETDHAITYKVSPCKSLALKIDDLLYYPSDSYRVIDESVRILALPTSGPWHKICESIEFANAIKSERILVTHNGLYNADGNSVANHFVQMNLADQDREYIFLEPGQTLP